MPCKNIFISQWIFILWCEAEHSFIQMIFEPPCRHRDSVDVLEKDFC